MDIRPPAAALAFHADGDLAISRLLAVDADIDVVGLDLADVADLRARVALQRIARDAEEDIAVFTYDTSGHLIAETDATGALKREILYLGDIPVYVVQ